jgi:transposase
MQSFNQKRVVRYSISFKQMVVNEVESGRSCEYLRRKYDIGSTVTIPRWVQRLGKNHVLNKLVRIETMEDKNRDKEKDEEIKRLKMALADAHMAKACLEEVIKMANVEYKTDLKKNFGTQLPKNSKPNTK